MFKTRKKDTDAHSSTSGTSKASKTSKASGERGRKTPRISLRRILCLRYPSARTSRATRSNSELETRSVSSLPPSGHAAEGRASSDRDFTVHRIPSEQSSSHSITSKRSKDSYECPLCLAVQPRENFPSIMTCHHRSCRDCLRQYLRIEITESRVNIACPECAERFHPSDIHAILEEPVLMLKYEEFMLRRMLVSDPDTRWCPAPDCGYAVIATGCASCPKIKCERPSCDTYFCYHCKQFWHPNQTCDAARLERSSVSYSHDSPTQDIKPCPRCDAFISKMEDGSCNHMTCAMCGAEFCWLCMKEISDLHYLSPSGCTFWGKKPWSRKKKILWQLGTLVGAPVGIGLVAGIAVPAMIIGIPVWVGRKLHAKYETAPKHKRNLIITGGVTASIIVSPLLAGLAVGIGVPILLAYVYGVVPISLCRSGGCGVTTTDNGGVRFDFDDDNDVTVGVSGPYSVGETQSVGTASHNLANPSIGPSIGDGMSLGNSLSASGSHIDHVGALQGESDRESASHRAIAGASLSGSLCGSTVAGPSGFHNRLEVQVDVASGHHVNKRASLSSESANFSLDAKSATVSFCDDASTKALTGSLCTRDKDNNSAIVPPMDVHMDVYNNTVQYSGTQDTTSTSHRPGTSGHGSPTSGRSVTFLFEDGGIWPNSRQKSTKRQSVSVGHSIHEHAEQNSECVSGISVDSLTTTKDVADLSSSSGGAGTLVSSAHTAPSLTLTPRCSDSAESVHSQCSYDTHHQSSGGLTAVESDHPMLFERGDRLVRHNSSSTDGSGALETDHLTRHHSQSTTSNSTTDTDHDVTSRDQFTHECGRACTTSCNFDHLVVRSDYNRRVDARKSKSASDLGMGKFPEKGLSKAEQAKLADTASSEMDQL